MRPLQTHDVFVAMNLINTAGIKEEFEKMTLKVNGKKDINIQQVGLEFMLAILGGCANPKSETLIYNFLGGILEKDPDAIRTQDPLQTIEDIKSLHEVISLEDWKSFFTSLGHLIKLN